MAKNTVSIATPEGPREVKAQRFGPNWAVTTFPDDEKPGRYIHTLTHIGTGLELTPWYYSAWTLKAMRRAAQLLSEQGDAWNFGPMPNGSTLAPKECTDLWRTVRDQVYSELVAKDNTVYARIAAAARA